MEMAVWGLNCHLSAYGWKQPLASVFVSVLCARSYQFFK